ncbi:DUF2931 family protein [Pseudomonas sp. UBA4194]|uniref:DUF2931 family protein n=1 Tax=Pseudomonas sp. UBA4194 TaxID=1947317 RepID=UPI0032E3B8E8
MALGKGVPKAWRMSLVLVLLSLSAYASGPGVPKLPYPAWYVGLVAPRHMEVWVESVDVLDQRGYAFFHVSGGVASYTGKAEGWHKGTGKTKPVGNVDLPESIFLRWQSLAEPQTYKIRIRIPQWVRDEMVRPQRVYCVPAQQDVTRYPDTINLGMAPGGIVKVWFGSGCLGYKEIGRFQANIEPLGPYKGEANGQYIRLESEHKAYIEKHGIPYGSW